VLSQVLEARRARGKPFPFDKAAPGVQRALTDAAGYVEDVLIEHRAINLRPLLHWAATQCIERPATYWHMLPAYSQGRKAIWTAVNPHTGKRRIDEAFPHELRANTNEQEMFIRFKTGATWQVLDSDRYDAAVGSPPAGITFSEWALSNPGGLGLSRAHPDRERRLGPIHHHVSRSKPRQVDARHGSNAPGLVL